MRKLLAATALCAFMGSCSSVSDSVGLTRGFIAEVKTSDANGDGQYTYDEIKAWLMNGGLETLLDYIKALRAIWHPDQ